MATKPIITDVTYLELVTLITTSGLTDGLQYLITDFKTVHYILNNSDIKYGINTGELEPLLLTATSNHTLDKEAKSSLYPEDIIYYDWNPINWLNDSSFSDTEDTSTIIISGFTGVIYFRHDTLLDNYMGYDFRNVKFRRWEFLVPEWNTESGYTQSDFVTYQNFIFKALIPNSGQTPSQSSDYWVILFDLSLTTYWSPNNSSFNGIPVNNNAFGDFKTFHEITGTTATYQRCCRSNHFESFKDDYYDYYTTGSLLSNNVFFLQDDNNYTVYSNQVGAGFSYNTIGLFHYNIIGNQFYSNIITSFYSNTIGNEFYNNNIGNEFYSNTIGNNFDYNNIANSFYYNTIGNGCNYNNIGNSFNNNTIGNTFYYNYIEYNVYDNIIGNQFISNIIGNEFYSNTIGNHFYSNTIGNYFYDNIIGNNIASNTIGYNFYYNTIGNNITYNTIGNDFYFNTIGNNFNTNATGDNFINNTICNSVQYTTIPTGVTFIMNTIRDNITGLTFTSSSIHVYSVYHTEIIITTLAIKLKYVDGSDDTEKIVAYNS